MAQYRPQTTGNRVTDEALRIVFDNLYSLQAKASGTTTSPDKCSDLEVAVRRAAALAITQAQTSSAGVAALIAVHTAIAGAHHAPFVGADATALIAAHAAIAGAHHAAFVAADAAALIAVHTAISAAHHARYTDGEADARIALHAAIAAAHHARYTDGEAVTAMGVLANINPLNHDRYTDAEAIAAVAIGDVVRGSAALTTDNKLVEVSVVDGSLQEISDQAANAVLAGPAAGVPAAPGFRALASTELSDTAGLVRGAASLTTATRLVTVSGAGAVAEEAAITALAGVITATGFSGPLTGNASGSAATITGNLTGDVTSVGMATTLVNIPSGTVMAGSFLATAIAAPGVPAGGKGSVYVDSTSKNLAIKDDAGVVKHGVQTEAGAANNWLTAISDAGLVSRSQPASTNLSDSAGLVRGAAALVNATVIPTISAAGTLGESNLKSTGAGAEARLLIGADRFLHNYAAAGSDGLNLFLGLNAGNFTMGPGGGGSWLGCYNIGIGADCLLTNSTGHFNVGIGTFALKYNTTGRFNIGIGAYSLHENISGEYNTAFGYEALRANTTGAQNSAFGQAALYLNTTGSQNLALGLSAGLTANPNTSGSQNVWIGVGAGPGGAGQYNNSIGIGFQAFTTASNQVVLGNVSISKTILRGILNAASLPIYANNAAAIAGGLVVGDFYRTNANPDPVCVVH